MPSNSKTSKPIPLPQKLISANSNQTPQATTLFSRNDSQNNIQEKKDTAKFQNTSSHFAALLSKIANIIDTINTEKGMQGKELESAEAKALEEITQLVLITKKKAEALLKYANLIVEYTKEMKLAELKSIVIDLGVSNGDAEKLTPHTAKFNMRNSFSSSGLGSGNNAKSIMIGIDPEIDSVNTQLDQMEDEILGWDIRALPSPPPPINTKNSRRKQRKQRKQLQSKELEFCDSTLGLISPAGSKKRGRVQPLPANTSYRGNIRNPKLRNQVRHRRQDTQLMGWI